MDNRITQRYGAALFELAEKRNNFESIVFDAETFLSACNDNREFLVFLKSPVIKNNDKKSILIKVFSKSFHQDTIDFIQLIIKNQRERFLPDIFKQFLLIYKEANSTLDAEVTTAVELTDEAKEEIKSFIKKISNYRNVDLTNVVDESVLGGFKLKYKSMLLDASISHELDELKKKFNK